MINMKFQVKIIVLSLFFCQFIYFENMKNPSVLWYVLVILIHFIQRNELILISSKFYILYIDSTFQCLYNLLKCAKPKA